MFKNTFQSGFLSILYSIGSKPLQIWDKKVRNGHIKRITDNDIQSLVLEVEGTNVSTTYITCPADPKKTLGIKLPFLVMIIKNLKKYFTFEVQVLDDKNVRRRFRASNYQSTTRVKPFICTMPMRLDDGWNQIQFNLSDFTRRAYGTNYIETLRVQFVDEMSEMSLRNTSLDSSDEDVSSSHCTDRLVKHQLLMNKFLDLQYRARERQEEFQSLLEAI
ncbi:LOW QUALITY PROTEIN: cilia- and flagella-associated protein 20-like [Carassius auratus]|uniref:LOW QUALITY PROTEIN: cilia- and flagella-associated protein 20-like n=1 Tax=Carassius auratus TaxID=7957 RepID=A0A6P6RLC5_CARAU|nr:LOW QUALITY PROTEIN: cilia- and flagella-associated protein 20-like [Carassius auratus]